MKQRQKQCYDFSYRLKQVYREKEEQKVPSMI